MTVLTNKLGCDPDENKDCERNAGISKIKFLKTLRYLARATTANTTRALLLLVLASSTSQLVLRSITTLVLARDP